MTSNVRDNTDAHRFELEIDGQVAVLAYQRQRDAIVFVHTEVPSSLRGRGVGEQLVKGALEQAQQAGLRIVATCPFVRRYLERHPLASSPRE
jgi:predicted GNAT family acetyltransferase